VPSPALVFSTHVLDTHFYFDALGIPSHTEGTNCQIDGDDQTCTDSTNRYSSTVNTDCQITSFGWDRFDDGIINENLRLTWAPEGHVQMLERDRPNGLDTRTVYDVHGNKTEVTLLRDGEVTGRHTYDYACWEE